MGSITIIMNCILSMWFLKEQLSGMDWGGILIICAGSCLFITQAKNDDVPFTKEELWSLYTSTLSLMFLSLSFVIVLGTYILDIKLKTQLKY